MKGFCCVVALACLASSMVLVGGPATLLGQDPVSKQGAGPEERKSVVYVTNPVGSGLYTISVGQSQVVGRKTNLDLKVQPAAGALAVPRLVFAREALLGVTTAKIIGDAYTGVGEYAGRKHSTVRALQSGQDTLFGIVANAGAGIKTIPDLKGKRITWNILTSDIARNVAFLEMKAYGIDGFRDVKMQKAESTSKGVEDLAQGRTDAAACSLGGAKIEELGTSKVKAVALPFDPAKIDVIQREMSGVIPALSKKVGPIPAGIPVVGTPEVFFAHRDLDDETAYRVVKVLLESQEDLKVIHRDFAGWTPDRAVKNLPIPYHPGAIRYYKEKGLWSAEMDQHQARLLQ